MVAGLSTVATGQDRAHLENLLAKIGNAESAIEALEELRALAKEDPDSRQYIANRLPSLIAIAARGDVQLWMSTLQLTADLKVVEAVPILTRLLRSDNRGGPTNFGMAAHLFDDPVANALSQIGEPAVDSVAQLFQDGDLATRRRATIVLWNIYTENAREAIRRQIDKEPDQGLKSLMQDKLGCEWRVRVCAYSYQTQGMRLVEI
jgi:HEAT repeat protein